MTRKENWPELFHDALMAAKDVPFEWGVWDCMSFACHMIEVQTGVDPYADFRGKYSTKLGAFKQIKLAGFDDLVSLVEHLAEQHGMKEIAPAFAQRGDLVQFDSPDGDVFAIVHHNGIHAIGVGESGLLRLITLEAKKAWRV